MSNLMSNYSPLEVTFIKGDGCWLTDTKGGQYLDALSGIGVVNLGHCHPVITKNLVDQSQQLLHTSNVYRIGNQEELAQQLCNLANMDKVFFSNSGAEANEAAIKIARLYARSKNIEKPIILTANQGFHGRTMATLSATGQSKVQAGFSPLMSEFIHVNYDDIDAINYYKNNSDVVAVMVEPIQGEAGVNGGPSGDLYVVISLKEHTIFQRDGGNLHCEMPISFSTAALGGEIKIPTLDGTAKIKISPETQTGSVFRLRGKGIKPVRQSQYGDLHCHVVVETPVKLNDDQKKLLEELEAINQKDSDKHSPKSKTWLDKVKDFF